MYQKFSIGSEVIDEYEIVRLKGYLEDIGGEELREFIENSIEAGVCNFGFDFTSIELISSPGVAALLDSLGRIVDDNAGEVVAWGLDKHHATVLEMSGFFFMAEQVEDEKQARQALAGE